jgi:hypothetical protein
MRGFGVAEPGVEKRNSLDWPAKCLASGDRLLVDQASPDRIDGLVGTRQARALAKVQRTDTIGRSRRFLIDD